MKRRGERSGEEWAKLTDNAIRNLKELFERWDNRLTLGDPVIPERYLESRLVLHVHLVERGADDRASGAVEYCAILHRTDGAEPDGPLVAAGLGDAEKPGHGGIRGDEAVMLVCDVELAEQKEVIASTKIRLDRAEDVHRRLVPGLFYSPKTGFKSLGATLDEGKVGVARPAVCSRSGIVHHSAPEDVKRGLHVVDRIASDAPPTLGRDCPDLGNDRAIAVRVSLYRDTVWASVLEGRNLGFEIKDVFFGPFDLDPNAGRWIEGHSPTVRMG